MILGKEILFEDNHIIALNKAPGIVVHDAQGLESLLELVAAYIKKKYQKKGNVFVHPVHRLDQPASGVILFAKTSKALSRLTVMFKDRKVKKVYWAVATDFSITEEGKLSHYIRKSDQKNVVSVHKKQVAGSKSARLTYSLVSRIGKYYLIEIDLETGRPHQIRAQLAKVGSPIVGDLKYGYKKPLLDKSIALHARSIELEHPVTKAKLEIIAHPPDNQVWRIFPS